MKLNQTIKRKKNVSPSKRSMNLYYKPDRTTKTATIMLYVMFFAVVLFALSKIFVYDIWSELRAKQEQLETRQEELAAYAEKLVDYDKVLWEYERYSATPEETLTTDRMELIALIDSAVRPTAKVDHFSVSGEQMLLQFSRVTLREVADIVQALEESPLVTETMVNTASTTESGPERVQANILIQLAQKEALEAAEAEGGEQQ